MIDVATSIMAMSDDVAAGISAEEVIPLYDSCCWLPGHGYSFFFFFFKQKTAYEITRWTGVQTCALPISRNRRRGDGLRRGPARPRPAPSARERPPVLPQSAGRVGLYRSVVPERSRPGRRPPRREALRSEEHTSELQSPCNLVCRLLLENK